MRGGRTCIDQRRALLEAQDRTRPCSIGRERGLKAPVAAMLRLPPSMPGLTNGVGFFDGIMADNGSRPFHSSMVRRRTSPTRASATSSG